MQKEILLKENVDERQDVFLLLDSGYWKCTCKQLNQSKTKKGCLQTFVTQGLSKINT